MTLISTLYFVGRNTIPNTGADYVTEALNTSIDIYEAEYLQRVLGYALYKAFIAGLSVEPPTEIEARFIALRDGAEFTYNGRTFKWGGFVDATTFQTPIADYVTFKYIRENETSQTGTGNVKAKNVNADVVSPSLRLIDIWNAMVEKNDMLYIFLTSSNDYPEFNGVGDPKLFKRFSPFGTSI